MLRKTFLAFGMMVMVVVWVSGTAFGDDRFRRGDCNLDGGLDIADAIWLFNCLFGGGSCVRCEDACDSNDDGGKDISDGVYILNFLFGGGPKPPHPYPDCGFDPTPDQLGCTFYPGCQPEGLPIFLVTQSRVDPEAAERFAEALGIQDEILSEDGSLRYVNQKLFLSLPTFFDGPGEPGEDDEETVLEGIDFGAIHGEVILGEDAIQLAERAFRAAEILPRNSVRGVPDADHAMFSAVDDGGAEIVTAPLNTNANFSFELADLPLIGPGAKCKLSFNSEGVCTLINYALRGVEEGPVLPLMPQEEADEVALNAYGNLPGVELTSELVYYAPPTEFQEVKAILPHYVYTGKIGETGDLLRAIVVPAVHQNTDLIPRVALHAESDGPLVFGEAEVSGGTPPYQYLWSSALTHIKPAEFQESVEYEVALRRGVEAREEILTVVVTDANGISVSAQVVLPISDPQVVENGGAGLGGVRDVGVEYIGTSGGLSGSQANAGGFSSNFGASGVTVRFNWGDYNAWEQDFKSSSFSGGDDADWVDNVDAVFYTGHASGNSFWFPGNNTDQNLHYNDARWGDDHDLEWITIAACGPLQLTSGGKQWWERWGDSFRGLHQLLGYQTITFDNTAEGNLFSGLMLAGWKVRTAWMTTGIIVQPATWTSGKKIYTSVMGPIGPNGWSNYNDHFWGEGSVGADIRGSDLRGWWIVWTST